MDYSAETLAIRAPAQIGPRIDSSGDGLPKKVWRTERQDTAQRTRQPDAVDRQCRLAGPSPNRLVGVGENGVTHFRKARSPIGTVLLGDLFCPEKPGLHGVPRRSERGEQNSASCNQSSPNLHESAGRSGEIQWSRGCTFSHNNCSERMTRSCGT